MNYDPATVRAVVAHLRRLADNAASAALRDPQRAMGYRTSANAILRQFGPEAPAPEPSTDTLREALETMLLCVERHDRWCGHNREAPGDSIINEAPRRAREALAAPPRDAEAHLWALIVWFGGKHEHPYVNRDVAAAAEYVNRYLSDQDMAARHREALAATPSREEKK